MQPRPMVTMGSHLCRYILLLSSDESQGSQLKAVRALRLFRLAKLLRLNKLRDVLSRYEEIFVKLAGFAKGVGYIVAIRELRSPLCD